MFDQSTKKEITQTGRPVLARRLPVPTISYQVETDSSGPDIEQRLDRAFDILFREFFKDQIELSMNGNNNQIDNSRQL